MRVCVVCPAMQTARQPGEEDRQASSFGLDLEMQTVTTEIAK